MNARGNWRGLRVLGSLAVAAVVMLAACKKEEAPPPAAAAPVDTTPAAAAAPDQQQQPAYTSPPGDNVQADIAQIDTRVQNQDYEGAVDVILRAQLAAQQQQSALSDQQRLSYHNRMRMLQKQIADAMAAGDPNAQRAAQLLMQYNAAATQGAR